MSTGYALFWAFTLIVLAFGLGFTVAAARYRR